MEEMLGGQKYIKYPTESFVFAGHQIAKCLAGNQNVRQSTGCLSDIFSGTPEIILAITELLYTCLPTAYRAKVHSHLSMAVQPPVTKFHSQ